MKQILKYILSVVLENLKISENKHTISITLSSAVIVFAATQFSGFSRLAIVFGASGVVACALAIITSFIALSSKEVVLFSASKKIRPYKNLTYFRDIVSFNENTFIDAIIQNYDLPTAYKVDGFDKDLSRLVVANAKIAKSKYSLFNFSLFFLSLGLMFVVTSVVISEVIFD